MLQQNCGMNDTFESSSVLHVVRPARESDLAGIVGMIAELAEFEQLSHLVEVSVDKLRPHLFGARPVAEAMVAESSVDGELHAFALYFHNFSTFLAKPGLYLEDLYVQPAWRGAGLGQMLLKQLAALAVERGCGRFEWSVLDWNSKAIAFYERMGAQVLPDWRICRVTGAELEALAGA